MIAKLCCLMCYPKKFECDKNWQKERLTHRLVALLQNVDGPVELRVENLPPGQSMVCLKRRLKQLSDNCGGKVTSVVGLTAIIHFANPDAASR